MRSIPRFLAVLLSLAPLGASAQTVINLTNAGGVGGSTNLDLTNTSVAVTTGGLFAGAISGQAQSAINQLNVLDMVGASGFMTPLSGPGMFQINMMAGGMGTSLTTNNIGAAVGIAPAWSGVSFPLGGFIAPMSALAGGSQMGINTMNGATVTFPVGSQVSLIQTGTPPGPLSVGPMMNLSTVNTLLANAPGMSARIDGSLNSSLNGSLNGGTIGLQVASSSFNTSTIIGAGSLSVQQFGGGAMFQAVNRSGAFSEPVLLPVSLLR